jgi:hypothetical protein
MHDWSILLYSTKLDFKKNHPQLNSYSIGSLNFQNVFFSYRELESYRYA